METIEKQYSKEQKDFEHDIEDFELEYQHVMESKALYMDSARIHGAPQRYLTKYLRLQLKFVRTKKKTQLTKMIELTKGAEEKIRLHERKLRAIEREITPLVQGVSQKAKEARRERLILTINTEFIMSRKIQKVFRGWRLRKAMYSWYRDYWEKFVDETTGSAYYYNTWSQETLWYEPFEYTLSIH